MLQKEKKDRKSSDVQMLQDLHESDQAYLEKEKKQKLKSLEKMKHIVTQSEF